MFTEEVGEYYRWFINPIEFRYRPRPTSRWKQHNTYLTQEWIIIGFYFEGKL